MSANEFEALAMKAARGAGAFPAQAAHFGRAAAIHLAQSRDPADVIAALHALPDGPIQTLPLQTELDPNDPLHQSYAALRKSPPSRVTRIACPSNLADILKTCAHNTYVPATDASRQGAGAGLTDSD